MSRSRCQSRYAPAIAAIKIELANVRERQRGIIGKPEAERLRWVRDLLEYELRKFEEADAS